MEVVKMCSFSNEIIPLVQRISTVKARGQVDKWLAELEIQMRLSLRQQIEDALKEYPTRDIEEAIAQYPNQAILCSDFITWTAKLETAITESGKMDSLKDENETYIQKLSKLVLDEQDKERTKLFANLILSQGYIRIVIEELEDKGVTSCGEFSWMSRLRYYWKENVPMNGGGDEEIMVSSVEIQMMFSQLNYGYEYLHSYTRLVMTPPTERCYRILLMAMDLHQGGLVSGETATGKTETVKDLARAAAKQCVGFNCSENLNYSAFAKFLKGLASCGAWSCFDEFHRIDVQVR